MTDLSTTVRVTVRYFGAAAAAAGTESATVAVEAGISVADLTARLAEENPRLAEVLTRCSYLRDEVAVRDGAVALKSGQTVDVLPPFAGG
jgi:molybdopterin converting factor small subunit